jgi:hypothetical protein
VLIITLLNSQPIKNGSIDIIKKKTGAGTSIFYGPKYFNAVKNDAGELYRDEKEPADVGRDALPGPGSL